ncbi:MAG: hypothetical protein P1V97_11200 [Planctomycetota bacterium]|nr:hypothetical protein [Planctomycetota bacterium]
MRTWCIVLLGLGLGLGGAAMAQEAPKKETPKQAGTKKTAPKKSEKAKKKSASVLMRWKKPLKEVMVFDTKLIPLQAKDQGLLLKQDLKDLLEIATAPIASFTESQPLWFGNVEMPFEQKLSTETYTILRPKKKVKDQFDVKVTTVFGNRGGQDLSPRTLIRATVNKNGVNQSFYVPQKEKNILSLFFRLPKEAVKEGDVWSVPFHFVNVPGTIECERSIQKNRVFLSEIDKTKDGRIIAYLEYRIIEHVKGFLPSPPGHGHNHQISLTMVFFGKARFDVTNGHWIRLRGRLRLVQAGEWKSDYEQIFTMDLRDEIPAALRKKQ